MSRGQRSVPMVITPTAEVVAFIAGAVREHRQLYRRNGAAVPDGVLDLMDALSFGVTQGHPGSSQAAVQRTEQIEPMTPRLVTYETAAKLLAISLSTLKRHIRAGDFHPISIGGASRIRVCEIDAFVAPADTTEEAAS
jgi:excisionase family DNA binding protein